MVCSPCIIYLVGNPFVCNKFCKLQGYTNNSLNQFIKTQIHSGKKQRTGSMLQFWIIQAHISFKKMIHSGTKDPVVCCLEIYKCWFCFNLIWKYFSWHSKNRQSSWQFKFEIIQSSFCWTPVYSNTGYYLQICLIINIIGTTAFVWYFLFISTSLTKCWPTILEAIYIAMVISLISLFLAAVRYELIKSCDLWERNWEI